MYSQLLSIAQEKARAQIRKQLEEFTPRYPVSLPGLTVPQLQEDGTYSAGW